MSKFIYNKMAERQLVRQTQMGISLKVFSDRAASSARSIAPVESGDYKAGIVSESGMDDTGQYISRVNATDFKSNWIEFGTIRSAARGILRRGAEAVGLRVRGPIA